MSSPVQFHVRTSIKIRMSVTYHLGICNLDVFVRIQILMHSFESFGQHVRYLQYIADLLTMCVCNFQRAIFHCYES